MLDRFDPNAAVRAIVQTVPRAIIIRASGDLVGYLSVSITSVLQAQIGDETTRSSLDECRLKSSTKQSSPVPILAMLSLFHKSTI